MLTGFEREASESALGRSTRVDFRLLIGNEAHLCELKALCISQAAGTPRNLNFYFRDDHVGMFKDFKKLDLIEAANKWVLAFVYPVPDASAWQHAVDLRPQALRHWTPVTEPVNCARDLFVSLWKCAVVERARAATPGT